MSGRPIFQRIAPLLRPLSGAIASILGVEPRAPSRGRRRRLAPPPRARRPNVLVVTTDQERALLPSPRGFVLPAHERLRARGVSFERHFVATAPCTPSRSVIWTGQHVPHTGMADNTNFPWAGPMSTGLETLGTAMRAAGYSTAYKGKWHLSVETPGGDGASTHDARGALEEYGFADFNRVGDYHGEAWSGHRHDGAIAADAAAWLHAHARDATPWLLVVSFVNPHDVMFMDNRSVDGERTNRGPFVIRPAPEHPRYQRRFDVELPASFSDPLDGRPTAHADHRRLMDLAFGALPLDAPELWRKNLSYYLSCLEDVDGHVSRVLDALDASGRADDTVVVYTSDHGELAGAHGLRQKGPLVYRENLGVPLVVHHPDGARGATTRTVSSSVDLLPTILGLVGLGDWCARELPELAGVDLCETVARPGAPGARSTRRGGALFTYDALSSLDPLVWERFADVAERRPGGLTRLLERGVRPDLERRGFLRGLADDRHTFARYFAPARPARPATLDALLRDHDVELYDDVADPEQRRNLAAEPEAHAALLEGMRAKLERLVDVEIGADDRALVVEPR
ncbi:sulfatase-like hydrolase/transferase [Myxococcota bacterium]|nr:sulfatase-like hydrolase/transferase [Myxococcota bacterium]